MDDYKKYALGQLENFLHDCMNAETTTAQEIYDVIKSVVEDNYYTYKNSASQAYELLALLNGNGKGHIEAYDSAMIEKEHYESSMPPWGHSDMEYVVRQREIDKKLFACDKDDTTEECKKSWTSFWEESSQYTDEELDAMCEKAASDEEKEKCREYNLREAEYYNDLSYYEAVAAGYTITDDGFWIPPQQEYLGWSDVNGGEFDEMSPKKDKVVKWQLPVEVDGASGEYYVNFPDDLLKAATLKEGDQVEWIDRNDGSFELRKVNGTK